MSFLNNNFLNFEFQELETLLENAKTHLSISWYFNGELWCQKKDDLQQEQKL